MAVEGTLSLRESLEEAFDEAEELVNDEPEELEVEEPEELEELEEETELEVEEDKAELGELEELEEVEELEELEEEPDLEAEAITDAITVPNGWRSSAKEEWDAIPVEAQKEIRRRENDVGRMRNESAEYRKSAESYTSVVQPFLPNIQAEGVTPPQAIQNLLQTAASLQMGSALVKAQTITRLIGAYGVDIQTLSDILTDSYKPTEEDKINAAVDARMGPFNQQQAQLQQQQNYNAEQDRLAVRAETDTWSESAEFVKEVGADMADLLEMAGNRKQELTLEDAYDKACMMNPEIRKVLAQREAAVLAKENSHLTRKKKKAGSSVTGASAGKPGAMQSTSLRGALEAAWDGLEAQ